MYETLDKLIIDAIACGKNPLYAGNVSAEAELIAEATKRKAFRVIDCRLQALRKSGAIMHQTKSESSDGWGGWKIVKK